MHDKMLASILKAPMIFFETNPAGRILSRFSRDFTETDRRLPFLFQAVVEMFLNILGTFILVAYASPFMLIVIVLIVPVYSYVLNLYRSCLRELKRIEAVSRSPLYSQINEILTGISTIRAFGVSDRFISISQGLQDNANRPTYIMSCLDIWIATRAESFVGIVIGMMAILGVALDIDLSLLGLALSYCLSAMFLLNFGLRHAAEVEARMNAVERLYHYANELPAEYTAGVSQKVANEWPVAGNISFRNLSIKYRPELPLILHSLNFDVPAGKKVGIVGRTGAGKSSIITAIFRLVEFAEGTIFIDDVDISNLELNDLRKKLAIIPQAPVLFDGTFRTNLDPFNNYKDEELWAVLHRCALHDYVSSLAEKLESRISEGGANLSMGQRQLLCLGRAMLIKSKILLIDEATASVDMETDSFIQKVIRADFSDCTVICIAHRLNTLMDYDSVLVMDNGRVVEVSDDWVELLKITVTAQYDSPKVLASNSTSLFSALIDETGPANAAVLRRLALE
ncbi:hypothetical protein HDU84_000905 [Entophlyctis sp. JEL0112]|nr:hypothetical protein HDU84_000905 [Entophlyctis sp. JEL0112]